MKGIQTVNGDLIATHLVVVGFYAAFVAMSRQTGEISMKAPAILVLVLSALSIFIPVGGVLLAIACGGLVVLGFRSQPTLSGLVFGLDIGNAAHSSPSLMLAGAAEGNSAVAQSPNTYGVVLLTHFVLFAVAVLWRMVRGPAKTKAVNVPGAVAEVK